MSKESQRDIAIAEFTSEGEEILQRVSEGLQAIEKGLINSELVSSIYRDMHTLKGTAQLFGFNEIGRVAHAFEASMDPIRKLNVAISPRLLESCLKGLDLLDRLLKEVQVKKSDTSFQQEVVEIITHLVDAASNQFNAEYELTKDVLILDDPAPGKRSFDKKIIIPVVEKKVMETKMPETVSAPEPELAAAAAAVMNPVSTGASAVENNASVVGDASIRVQVSLLDSLMNLVGELVLVRNQFLQYRDKNEAAEFLGMSKNLDVVASELQSEVMKTRMQPIGNVVAKFQRVVRDIAKDLNKKIDLTIEGAETELDKTLLEAIKDPLTHLVRNSCDHGVETIPERKAAGKPETGHLLIRSFHEGGQVVIEISDDGKGLDRKRIVAKGIERGLISQEQAGKLQDREICNLIFSPGFSTAKEVTSVSGRGVGMDVVKTNVEKIGGTIELNSVFGKGTTIRLKIPLTLAIVPAMLVRSGTEKFAIPQVKLVELVRIEGDQANGIEYLQGRPMYRLRGALLSLIDINEITGDAVNRDPHDTVNIVVLNAEGEVFGLMVDEILDTADIVVKPLGSFLKHLSVFSGATILGDGSIALILDVAGMALAGKIDTKKEHADDGLLSGTNSNVSVDVQDFLIFSLDTGVVHSLPLCLVQRLEEFKAKDVERSGEQRVVRYRGSLLPLINLRQTLKYEKVVDQKGSQDFVSVIVVQKSGRNYGIEVTEILDVVSVNENIDDSICDRPGILGNIIYNNSVIVVVDALSLIDYAIPNLNKSKGAASAVASSRSSLEEIRSINKDLKNKKVRVLFAEDVAFFRRHVIKVLTEAGFEVSAYEDGSKALEALENAADDKFNLIISDIEMPEMNGLEFAREVRKLEKHKTLPMIALTTKFRDVDIDAGRQAGFDIYLEKLNPDKLLASIEKLLGPTAGLAKE
jgi:two-component system, chemotaxis family, sensor kinase CheA